MIYFSRVIQCLLLWVLASTSATAAPNSPDQVDSHILSARSAGLWYNPHHDGEGFSFQISDGGNNKKIFTATWYTFDKQRQQMWLIGTQIFNPGETSVSVAFQRPTGTRFGNKFNSNDVKKAIWGLVTFDFQSCNEATATINSSTGFGTGVIPLNKLVDNSGVRCTNPATAAEPPFYSDAGGIPVPPPQQGLGEGMVTSRGDHSVDGIKIDTERLFQENGQCFIEIKLINRKKFNQSVNLVYYFFLEDTQVAFTLFDLNFGGEKELTTNRAILSVTSASDINCNAFDEVRIESLSAQQSP